MVYQPAIDGPRACTLADLPEVIGLVDAAMREGIDQTLLTDYPLVYRPSNLPNVQVVAVGGHVAAVVPVLPRAAELEGCPITIGIISPTATAPEHRHRRFGWRCLDAVIERMRALHVDLSILWTLVPTFPFYEGRGWQAIRYQSALYRLRPEDAAAFPGSGDAVREVGERGAPDVVNTIRRLHEAEFVGIRRTPDEYEALLTLPKMRTLLAVRNGRPISYLIVSQAVNKPGLIEAGGEESGVEQLIGAALRDVPAGGVVEAQVNLSPTVFERVLARRRPERREIATANMMIRINEVAAFLRAVAPVLARRLAATSVAGDPLAVSIEVGDAGERVSLRQRESRVGLGAEVGKARGEGGPEVGPEGGLEAGLNVDEEVSLEVGGDRLPRHLELSRRELTSVVFGAHPERLVSVPEPLERLFPLYLPIWMLDRS